MSFVKPAVLFIFVVLSLAKVNGLETPSVKDQDVSKVNKASINELISATELNSMDRVYAALVKNRIKQKTRDTCHENKECIAKWTELEKQLLKEEAAQIAKSRERMVQLLTTRYSKEQLDWLLKTYNTPLLVDFRKFINSSESTAAVDDMYNFVNAKIKQADSVTVKPATKQ